MKNQASTKLIFFQPGTLLLKQGSPSWPSHHRLWLLTFLSFFTLASLLTLLAIRPSPSAAFSSITTATASPSSKLPSYLFDALLHYASSNVTHKMPQADFDTVAAVLRRHSPCNLLVFGLGFESLLWRALNHNGRTVFIDENSFYISRFEERHKGVEAYDVHFATRVAEAPELLRAARYRTTTI